MDFSPRATTDHDPTAVMRAVDMRSYESADTNASRSAIGTSDDEGSDSEAMFARAAAVTHDWLCDFESLRKRGSKAHGETFTCGDAKWRLMMYPFGTERVRAESLDDCSVSLFLDTVDRPRREDELSKEWRRHCKFELQMLHPKDASMMVSRDATHSFCETESDWGFTSFVSRKDVYEKGYVDAEGCVTFRVIITPCEEHEVERIGMQNNVCSEYDSRKETGFIGLKNQGATCYMNSLLQTLYHIPSFRRAVYHMPTNETEEAHLCMPLALQSVFYCLQYASEGDVSTEDLTRSFGWDSYDSFMQHDVQELNRVLQDKLEEQMKQTCVEGTIQKLFEGHTTNFIECINVDYKSERKEEFLDLQLDVKGCKDIYASFDRYTEIEKLDGDNKYRAEGFGLQDARKGTLFHNFPPVLTIQLKRFEYDFNRDMMVKIHDRYEFPEELDLDVGDRKYLVPDSDKSVRNKYKLHSVLVHSGGINGGHYYAFIRPDLQDEDAQWYKFDDEHVTKESTEKAVMDQYGSGGSVPVDSDMEADDDSTNVRVAPNLRYAKMSSAYMLVYVRESDMDQMMCDANKCHLSAHLQARFAGEQAEKERRALEKAEAHLYTVIKVLQKKSMQEQIETEKFFDLGNFDSEHAVRFRLPKKTTFKKFKALVAEELGVPVARQRYWLYSPRRNKTSRPVSVIPEEKLPHDATVENMRVKFGSPNRSYNPMGEFRLLLEEFDDKTECYDLRRCICLHLKVYNPFEARLTYAGSFYANVDETLHNKLRVIKEMAGIDQESKVLLFEEIAFVHDSAIQVDLISPHQIENFALMDDKESKDSLQLGNGDILVVQPDVTEVMEETLKFPNVAQFMEYRHNHQVVIFRDLAESKVDKVRLELTKLMSYDQVAEALADAIELSDPMRLRFTAYNVYTNGPKSVSYKFRGMDNLVQMLDNQQSEVLYYEVLDIPLPELEQLKTLKVSFHAANTKLVQEFQLRLPKNATVQDVLEEIKSQLGDKVGPDRKLRLLELFYSQIYKVFDEDKEIADINDQYWTLRAEEVPEDEPETDKLLRVYSISKDLSNPSQFHCYDEPFMVRISESETFGALKERIKNKLEVPDEDFAKCKFYAGNVPNRFEPLSDDDDLLLSTKFNRVDKDGFLESILGIERDVKGPRRPASRQGKTTGGFERAIKIL